MRYVATVILLCFLFSCSKDQISQQLTQPTSCDSLAFTFDNDIIPIFTSYCTFQECHAAGGLTGYDFTDYDVVENRVRAGTLEYRIDLPFDDPQHMPEGMHLTSCDYYIIKTWIRQGFPEN